MEIEKHPLEPFLPINAKVLFLGSFPPQTKRWSMPFFYPNFLNDMWRIWGLIWYNDANYFIIEGEKKFDYQKVVDFCNTYGFAIYDTASAVRRLQDNASDKFLEVVEETNIEELLSHLPQCKAIVTTGEKATDVLSGKYGCAKPAVGKYEMITIGDKTYQFFRMPSSSRAYPLALTKKTDAYRILKQLFIED